MNKLVLVGCGNMGFAMLQAWIESGLEAAQGVTVVEPVEPLRERAKSIGVTAVENSSLIPAEFDPDFVIFAVKPQVMPEVVKAYKHFANGKTGFLSIAAGIKISLFEELLGSGQQIIRCMPNTPAAIGKGMMVLTANNPVSLESRSMAAKLLEANGRVEWVDDESLMDAVTAVSGSGPAYVFHFIECLTAAARKAGLPEKTAAVLAMQTVYGAASLAFESEEEPGRLREQVTSPKGTTEAALRVLMGESRLEKLVGEAVEAARKRSEELGS
jgi:pyrroline-5-carboxylate reductase